MLTVLLILTCQYYFPFENLNERLVSIAIDSIAFMLKLFYPFFIQIVDDIGKLCQNKVFLVAAADSSEGLPPSIRRCFSHELSMSPLSEEQRIEMLQQSLQNIAELLPNVCTMQLTSLSLFSVFS